MPMQWNAENQSKLLSLIFKKCDVKVPADIMKEIAAEMGSDCTPKAITHQIAKIRGGAVKTGDAESATPKKRASPAKKTSAKGKKVKKAEMSDEENGDGDIDSENDGVAAKRVKTEIKSEDKPESGDEDEDM